MWLYYTGTPADGVMVKGTAGDGNAWKNLGIRLDDDPVTYRQLNWRSRGGDTVNALNSGSGLPLAQWTHIAITFDVNAPGNNQKIYINGKLSAENRSTNPLTTNTGPMFIGAETYTQPAGRWWYQGMIDEGSLYNRALNPVEIKTIAGVKDSTDPTPKDGATVSSTNVLLEWWQGSDVANTNGHHLYFGDTLADVSAGTANTDKGFRTDPNYAVSNLVPGTTYYWRVDEVNDSHPDKIWPGGVWSFKVASSKAAVPNPLDGALYVGRSRILSWAPGTGAISHHVYFSKDESKVIAGHADADKGARTEPNYNPGTLTYDSSYFWRIDEFDGTTTHTGDVWSFMTTASADPNLVAWWTFDTIGSGDLRVLDVSGNENHGRFINDANLVTVNTRPYAGATGVLNLNGTDECVYVPFSPTLDVNTAGTIAIWVLGGAGNDAPIRHGGWNASYSFRLDNATTRYIQFRTTGAAPGLVSTLGIPSNQWTHIALTFDYRVPDPQTNQKIYINGVLNAQNRAATALGRNLYYVAIGGRESASAMWGGMIDDARIYNRALTASEVQVAMTGDPNLAMNPQPADRSTPDEPHATPLTWTRGANAAQHDVYFGTSFGAVQNATPSDPLGVYVDRRFVASFTPPTALLWDQTYYWRIDEVNDNYPIPGKSPWKGRVWSFTVANFANIDDMEDYNNFPPDRIFETWIDGYGNTAVNGALVGHQNPDFTAGEGFAETTIRHGGNQSMPYYYDTNFKYSEATMTLTGSSRDWTQRGIKSLSLWFRGYPVTQGSFTESPAGTFTMTGAGADIYSTADEFYFAWKMLNGPGSITAKVNAIIGQNLNAWAKAGVMIRQSLDPNSPHAHMLISNTSGIALQYRLTAAGASSTVTLSTVSQRPLWIKLERDFSGNFSAYHANDVGGAPGAWTLVNPNPVNIQMATNVYIGLALTSHQVYVPARAVFSNVIPTGNVTGQWIHQDIGILSNAPERMFVSIANTTGQPAVVYHTDPNAVLLNTFTEWPIPLTAFSGINLSNVDTISIGFGTKGNTSPGGSGLMYFDDIKLYGPRCMPTLLKAAADFNSDCVVNYRDLDVMANAWLLVDQLISTTAPAPTGLVGHWKLDDGSGTVARDSSGNNYNGTITGTPQWVTGHTSGALEFDGSSYVQTSAISLNSDTVTMTAWIKRNGDQLNSGIVFYRATDNATPCGIGFTGAATPNQLRYHWNNNSSATYNWVSGLAVPNNEWVFVALVIEPTKAMLYLNGGSATNAIAHVPQSLANINLGRDPYTTESRLFRGVLDDARLYSRALSLAEIAYLADPTPGDGLLHVPVQSPAELYSAEPDGSQKVNFKDYSALAESWLQENFWP
jgi:hypothetical protein